jgi:hypothetical protein
VKETWTRYRNLLIREAGAYACIESRGRCRAILQGRRQIKRAKELFTMMTAQNIDLSLLDDRFFAVLSLYLCEERDLNTKLLYEALRRFA